jgi:hypothetical protein
VVFFPPGREAIDLADLEDLSARYATALAEFGINSGSMVGVLDHGDPRTLVKILGVLRAGLAVCVLPSFGRCGEHAWVARLAGVLHRAQICHLTTGPGQADVAERLRQQVPLIHLPDLPAHGRRSQLPQVYPGKCAVVQLVAGGGGGLLPVSLSHRAVLAGVASLQHCLGHSARDVLVLPYPMSHYMGLLGIFYEIAGKGSVHVYSNGAFRYNPVDLIRYVEHCPGTVMFGAESHYSALSVAASDILPVLHGFLLDTVVVTGVADQGGGATSATGGAVRAVSTGARDRSRARRKCAVPGAGPLAARRDRAATSRSPAVRTATAGAGHRGRVGATGRRRPLSCARHRRR